MAEKSAAVSRMKEKSIVRNPGTIRIQNDRRLSDSPGADQITFKFEGVPKDFPNTLHIGLELVYSHGTYYIPFTAYGYRLLVFIKELKGIINWKKLNEAVLIDWNEENEITIKRIHGNNEGLFSMSGKFWLYVRCDDDNEDEQIFTALNSALFLAFQGMRLSRETLKSLIRDFDNLLKSSGVRTSNPYI